MNLLLDSKENPRFIMSLLALCALAFSFLSFAQEPDDSVSVKLDEVVVTEQRKVMNLSKATNSQLITSAELKRAACCNLGESFTTNPSVDVSYTDAATGARQIKLLGLSGTYVQMLTENVPNFRISAAPYGLGYVPGPWMRSIQVSKGASSVKNGYESITGQINIEFKKPQSEPGYNFNGYIDQELKLEGNADANWSLSDTWSTGILAHVENSFEGHDGNGDGFLDMPRVRQVTLMDRWAYLGTNYVFQVAGRFLDERRRSGQHGHNLENPYEIEINTTRWEAFAKNAYIFDHDNDGNIALILSGTYHDQDAAYGLKRYVGTHKNFYASLMFERKWGELHSLSTGLSFNYDHLYERLRATHDATGALDPSKSCEGVSGAYAQYTLNVDEKLLLMGGVRYDYSSLYGSMFTPRFHGRFTPVKSLSINASIGRGYRSPHAMAENNYLLASSREIIIDSDLHQEEAWNMGASVTSFFPLFGRTLNLSAEYYYTDFKHQLLIDLETDAHAVYFKNLEGRSYSHTWQIEADYNLISDLDITLAWRRNNVKVDYGQGLMEKPLLPRDKWLLSASYAPMMGIWQFDATLTVNGSGRMPTPYLADDGGYSWGERFKAFPQLNAQVTRNFRHFSLYLGGENLTNYRQPNPIISADDPYGPDFDSTLIYGPLHGVLVYLGFRLELD